jgi:outer membrane lipoprotein
MFRRLLFALLPIVLAGCATHPISKPLRTAATGQPSFAEIARAPSAYQGETIVVSGVVLGAFLAKEGGTVLEVLQVPADDTGRPTDPDRSQGRLLVLSSERLDPAVYRPGREVAVGGPIVRAETREVPGGGTLTYPVVEARELHLFPARVQGAPSPFSIGIGIGVGF